MNFERILKNVNKLIQRKKINEADEYTKWFLAGIKNFLNDAKGGHKIIVLPKNFKMGSRIEFYGFKKFRCLSYNFIELKKGLKCR